MVTEQDAVLAGMGTASWSAEDCTAYEVAMEGISHVVGAYSGLITRAEKAGDAARAAELTAEQGAWAARRKSLTPEGRTGVDAVTAESAQVLEQLRSAR
ncbi:hypothetical protein ACFXGT_02145 [Streptomyces sp. NPDC059352]|uniref:hypothetical protein n=1 Tax=Streptomyces sp. NPDC059352 TaxID=3346810 RepID=UPI0036B01880